MEHLVMQFLNKGMRLDLSPANASNEFAFLNNNIRITCRDGNTLFSSTNERGTAEIRLPQPIRGHVIGCCPIGDKVVVFTAADRDIYDRIYLIQYDGRDATLTQLYYGQLKFNKNYHIDTLFMHETEFVLKVYWIDGLNQPRFINIVASEDRRRMWTDKSFDFVPYIDNDQMKLTVEKVNLSNGAFKAGVIQYAVSYTNKNGVETNIFAITPLQYITHKDRGAAVDERVNISFKLTFSKTDQEFEYLRIYSIYRSSIDSTPVTKVVAELKLEAEDIVYIDNNNTGYDVDPQSLFFIGGEKIVPYTLELKDNTLFVGNYKTELTAIPEEVKDMAKTVFVQSYTDKIQLGQYSGYYSYENLMYDQSDKMKIFQPGQAYRLGMIGIHETGKASEVIYIKGGVIHEYPIQYDDYVLANKFKIDFTGEKYLVILKLKDLGYKYVLPVIVYPEMPDRNIIASGILCPTIYNLDDRRDKTVDVYSSWFARPNIPSENHSVYTGYGWYNEYNHDKPIFDNTKLGAELLTISRTPPNPYTNEDKNERGLFIDKYSNNFFVDLSVLTFHSPDLTLNEEAHNMNFQGYKMRIVGVVPFDSFASDVSVSIKGLKVNSKSIGLYKPYVGKNLDDDMVGRKAYLMTTLNIWSDRIYNPKDQYKDKEVSFPVYPWHRLGSVTNANPVTGEYEVLTPAELDQNKLSNLRYSYNTLFVSDASEGAMYNAIGDMQFIGAEENLIYRIKLNGQSLLYKPNVDKISLASDDGYKLCIAGGTLMDQRDPETLARRPFVPISSDISDTNVANDPVHIKYRSDKHLVVTLDGERGFQQSVLPHVLSDSNVYNRCGQYPKSYNRVFDDKITGVNEHVVNLIAFTKNKLTYKENAYLGDYIYQYEGTPELKGLFQWGYKDAGQFDWYRVPVEQDTYYFANEDDSNTDNYRVSSVYYCPDGQSELQRRYDTVYQPEIAIEMDAPANRPYMFYAEIYTDKVVNQFGGESLSALIANKWLKCGERVLITDTSLTLKYEVGDTYYQRYDAIKTYPSSLTDQNNVSDIVSFMCMSRLNIDGRYDKNRGLRSNLTLSPEKFNLVNDIYTQLDNFFQYHVVDPQIFASNEYKTDIMWSMPKIPGEDIDSWTKINPISTLLMDGDKGLILKLVKFNNEIFCLQEQGLSHVIFNARVQLATSDNVPIEVTNSNKVDGKRYISNTIGTDAKQSVCCGANGIYFADNRTNSIYVFNGQLLLSLSDLLYMRQWVSDNLNRDFKISAYYDCSNDDVYFVNAQTALCYSEYINTFTSFYSYEGVDAMFNCKDDFMAIKDNKLWLMFNGEYNMFFGKFKPYSMTFIANQHPLEDKVFNVLEYLADFYDSDGLLDHHKTFTDFTVWNEYQSGYTRINKDRQDAVKRFRNWRLLIPRDSTNNMDRIRNPWCFFTLSNQVNDRMGMKFNNVIMHYMK